MLTPSAEGRALLQAVLDQPGDDTARLVYADWLQESGGPDEVARAEFIRVQVGLEALERGDRAARVDYRCASVTDNASRGCWCRGCEMKRRERALWGPRRRAAEWFPELDVLVTINRCTWDHHLMRHANMALLERGFISAVRYRTADWASRGGAVLDQHPITRVILSGFTVEISPPRPGRGWQLHYYEPGAGSYFVMALGLDTREKMIDRLMFDVRGLETEFA